MTFVPLAVAAPKASMQSPDDWRTSASPQGRPLSDVCLIADRHADTESIA